METSQNEAISKPKPIRRKIDAQTVEEVCALVAKRITETGACLMLGVDPDAWFNWKGNNKTKFNESLNRVRETKIRALLDSIEQAGSRSEKPDWRAHAWLLERAHAPERYGAKVTETGTQAPTINVTILAELSRLVFGDQDVPVQGQLTPPVDVSALPVSGPDATALPEPAPVAVVKDDIKSATGDHVSENDGNQPVRTAAKPTHIPVISRPETTVEEIVQRRKDRLAKVGDFRPRRKQGDRSTKTYLQRSGAGDAQPAGPGP